MQLTASLVALALACNVAALPSGSLFAKRLPKEFNDALVERNNNGGNVDINKGNYPVDSGIINYHDPVSNLTLPYPPTYRALSAFDYASFNLGLYQEYIELDLFHNGLARFSDAEFDDAGINAEFRSLIRFFANQEVAHATLLTNILGPGAAQQCTYSYPYTTVREFVDFCQRLTRWGESGVYGFLSKLNSPDSATLLTNSIVTEARQQFAFRQLSGGFPIPEAFVPGIPQSWQWTLLAPYITSCPAGTPRIQWSNYPSLNVTRQSDGTVPRLTTNSSKAALSTNSTGPIIAPSEALQFKWGNVGEKVGPDGSYKTLSNTTNPPTHALFISHINATYAPLFNVQKNSATAYVPYAVPVFQDVPDIPVLNGTEFVVLVDKVLPITPYNLSMINAHVVAGPSMIQFG